MLRRVLKRVWMFHLLTLLAALIFAVMVVIVRLIIAYPAMSVPILIEGGMLVGAWLEVRSEVKREEDRERYKRHYGTYY